jgi:hypothetical protein
MSGGQRTYEKPVMTTVNNRPTPVLHKLNAIDDALVQCRLASGEDVYVPLKEIYALFEKELITNIRRNVGIDHNPFFTETHTRGI